MANLEQLKTEHESSNEAIKPTLNKKETLAEAPETTVELSPRDIEARAEKAKQEALETAVSTESKSVEKESKKVHPSRRGPINKKQQEKSFRQTMSQIQKELPATKRVFSKVIHNNVVEKTSEVIGGTVARPNALLAGAFVAFVLTILTYTVAKTIGYSLSGFETIAAFILGWIIGITYDYLRALVTGKKS